LQALPGAGANEAEKKHVRARIFRAAMFHVALGVTLLVGACVVAAATYGDGSHGYSDRTPLAELRPLNMYGFSKHLFDRWAEKKGLLTQIAGLKYFNVYGPYEDHKGDNNGHKQTGMSKRTEGKVGTHIHRGWVYAQPQWEQQQWPRATAVTAGAG